MNVIELISFVVAMVLMLLLSSRQKKERRQQSEEELFPDLFPQPKKHQDERATAQREVYDGNVVEESAIHPLRAEERRQEPSHPKKSSDEYAFSTSMDQYSMSESISGRRFYSSMDSRPKSSYEVFREDAHSRAYRIVKGANSSMRDAMLLRELLDKPLGLRDRDFLP